MYTPAHCLLAGLEAKTLPYGNGEEKGHAYLLGWLASAVGSMLSSENPGKREARAELENMLKDGRRILRAAEYNARSRQPKENKNRWSCTISGVGSVHANAKKCTHCENNKGGCDE